MGMGGGRAYTHPCVSELLDLTSILDLLGSTLHAQQILAYKPGLEKLLPPQSFRFKRVTTNLKENCEK